MRSLGVRTLKLSSFELGPIKINILGWFKNPLSSQTEKLMAATKFSDYLQHFLQAT